MVGCTRGSLTATCAPASLAAMRPMSRLTRMSGVLALGVVLAACGDHATAVSSTAPATAPAMVAFGAGSGEASYCVDTHSAVIYQPITVRGEAVTFAEPRSTQDTDQLTVSVAYAPVPRTFEGLVAGTTSTTDRNYVQRIQLGTLHTIKGARLMPGTYAVVTSIHAPSTPGVQASTLKQVALPWTAVGASGTASYVWNTSLGTCP